MDESRRCFDPDAISQSECQFSVSLNAVPDWEQNNISHELSFEYWLLWDTPMFIPTASTITAGGYFVPKRQGLQNLSLLLCQVATVAVFINHPSWERMRIPNQGLLLHRSHNCQIWRDLNLDFLTISPEDVSQTMGDSNTVWHLIIHATKCYDKCWTSQCVWSFSFHNVDIGEKLIVVTLEFNQRSIGRKMLTQTETFGPKLGTKYCGSIVTRS